jgi:hypothetical protein
VSRRAPLQTLNLAELRFSMVIRERGWECFAVYHDELSAGVVADYLRRNDCPAQVMGCAGTALDNGVRVLVPGELLHRARWLWAKADLTEAELQYLATGELPVE